VKKLRKKHHFPKKSNFFYFFTLENEHISVYTEKYGKHTETKENSPEKQKEIDTNK